MKKYILTLIATSIFFNVSSQLAYEEMETLLADFEPNYLTIADADDDMNDDIIISSLDENFITVFFYENGFVPMNLIVGETASRRGVTIEDLDGDGITDLAITDMNLDRVSILLGLGNREFAEPIYFETGSSPVDISGTDIDLDGDIDLVVANNSGSSVSVLVNDGNGDFSNTSELSVETAPETIRCHDLNGDFFVDLIVVNNGSNSISIIYGTGGGNFSSGTSYSVNTAPEEAQIADFNTDGFDDIVVVHDESTSISILYGQAMNSFAEAVSIPVSFSTSPGVFTATDLNEDNTVDIAVNAKNQRSTMVLLNDGLGSFTESTVNVNGSGGTLLSDVIAADLFGDGHLGLVATNQKSFQVIITSGDGMGNFSGYREIDTTPSPYRITSNDFNNDGYDDVAVANFFAGFTSIFLNNGKRGFHSPINRGSLNLTTIAIQSDDVDNDGFIDVIVGDFSYTKVFYGDNDNSFADCATYSMSLNNSDFRVADINNDNNTDIITLSGAYLGDGNRSFNFSHSFSTPVGGPLDMIICDIDDDGFPDRIASDRFNDRLVVSTGNGNGTFNSDIYIAVQDQPYGINTGDFNEDDVDDIAVSHLGDGSVSIILGTTATLTENLVIANDNTFSPKPLHVADLNNDLHDDIITLDEKIYIYLGNGDGTFADLHELNTTFNPQDLGILDIDNNGFLDLLVGTQQTGIALTLHLADIEPTVASSDITFSQIDETSATISWNKGNGDEQIVIAKKSLEVGGLPTDNLKYEANSEFGKGSEIGIGNFVVYQGEGNTFELTGLDKGTTYHFAVIDLNKNGTNTIINYRTIEFTTGSFSTIAEILNVEKDKVLDVVVYPNPTLKTVYVSLEKKLIEDRLNVVVTDLAGKEVMNFDSQYKNQIALDFGTMKTGFYLINIQAGSQSIISRVYKK